MVYLCNVGRIMAIDYGTRRTGLAVTDPSHTFAFPHDTVPTHLLFEYLVTYLQQESIDSFIVGDPKRLNNTSSDTTKLADQFTVQLKKKFPDIPVIRFDERLTSKMASQSMIESGQSRKLRRDKSEIDRVSAALILQNYLTSLSGNL